MSRLNSSLTRSAPFSPIRLASSPTVMASGTITSRTCFSRGLDEPPPCITALFLTRTLKRGERTCTAALVFVERFGNGQLARTALVLAAPATGAGSRALIFRLLLFLGGASGSGRATGVNLRAAGVGSCLCSFLGSFEPWRPLPQPRRQQRLLQPLLRALFGLFFGLACFLRRASSRLRLPAWLSARRACELPQARLQALFLGLALKAGDAFLRRLLGQQPSLRRLLGRWAQAQAPVAAEVEGAAAGAASGAGVSPGFTSLRRRFTSTATLLVRPWLKVCLTSPASTALLRPSGLRVRFLLFRRSC